MSGRWHGFWLWALGAMRPGGLWDGGCGLSGRWLWAWLWALGTMCPDADDRARARWISASVMRRQP